MVIEVDGGQHAENEEMDIQRSAYLNKMGYRVFRFWNNEVLQETEAVLTAIFAILATGKQNSPSPRPSPIGGEGDSLRCKALTEPQLAFPRLDLERPARQDDRRRQGTVGGYVAGF